MNFDFTDDQQAIKRTANELLAARFKPERVRELAEAGAYDDDAWKELSELGWAGIFIDEEHGGQGLGIVELIILMEELGYSLAPVPFLSNAAAGLLIQDAGSEEQKQRWLPGIASGEARGSVGIVQNGEAALVPDADSAEVIMLLEVECSRSTTYYAAWTADSEPETLPLAAAMAKAYSSDAGWRVTTSALQVFGGIGFTWEHDLHFFIKRARVLGHLYGSPREHRDRVADYVGLAREAA